MNPGSKKCPNKSCEGGSIYTGMEPNPYKQCETCLGWGCVVADTGLAFPRDPRFEIKSSYAGSFIHYIGASKTAELEEGPRDYRSRLIQLLESYKAQSRVQEDPLYEAKADGVRAALNLYDLWVERGLPVA